MVWVTFALARRGPRPKTVRANAKDENCFAERYRRSARMRQSHIFPNLPRHDSYRLTRPCRKPLGAACSSVCRQPQRCQRGRYAELARLTGRTHEGAGIGVAWYESWCTCMAARLKCRAYLTVAALFGPQYPRGMLTCRQNQCWRNAKTVPQAARQCARYRGLTLSTTPERKTAFAGSRRPHER
jgi:hypothetical protein